MATDQLHEEPFFSKVLQILRTSRTQQDLRAEVLQSLKMARAACVLAGSSIALGCWVIADQGYSQGGLQAFLLGVAGWACFRYSTGRADRAVRVAMLQDRVYFTDCLRAATTAQELDAAGLWGYLPLDESASAQDWSLAIHADIQRLQLALAVLPDKWSASTNRVAPIELKNGDTHAS